MKRREQEKGEVAGKEEVVKKQRAYSLIWEKLLKSAPATFLERLPEKQGSLVTVLER